MQNRIKKKFLELKKAQKKAFIVFVTAGDPDLQTTKKLVLNMSDSGVDIVELGVPFSDPLADGPTIQAASNRALVKEVNLKKIFNLVVQIRKASSIPIVLMTYYNPIFKMGIRQFLSKAAKVGVDGVIIPDLPPEEAKDLRKIAKQNNIAVVLFLSPTSSEKRIKLISKLAEGFIYYVSLTGVTGVRKKLSADLIRNLHLIKRYTNKPVCVGFGISHPQQIKKISRVADGVIVGSAIVKRIQANIGKKDLIKRTNQFIKYLSGPLKK